MSCEEVRLYLEGGGPVETPRVSRAAVEEHIARCPECAGVRAGQDRLRASFALVRNETPSIPRSLDEKVLASYREHIRALAPQIPRTQIQIQSQIQRPRRPVGRSAGWVLAWASAAAFALAICFAGIAWFTRAPQATRTTSPTRAAASPVPSTDEAAPRARAARTRARKQTTQAKRFAARIREPEGARAQSDGDGGFPPAGFRGLMYCDEISCAGALDVIRVEVPAQALGVPLRARPGSRPVEADVLVGPDGVARGIRVVE